MASRKTYFGIGWPKDPADAIPGAPGTREPEDRSAPTVVDDEKVAEGLKQLRSWYQGDAQQEQNRADSAVPAPYAPQGSGSTGSHARPTAVGHASGSPPAMPRPMAPDPMRATMYGHDVHQFEFPPGPGDATPTPQQPPPPAAVSTALVVADPSRPTARDVPPAGRDGSGPGGALDTRAVPSGSPRRGPASGAPRRLQADAVPSPVHRPARAAHFEDRVRRRDRGIHRRRIDLASVGQRTRNGVRATRATRSRGSNAARADTDADDDGDDDGDGTRTDRRPGRRPPAVQTPALPGKDRDRADAADRLALVARSPSHA